MRLQDIIKISIIIILLCSCSTTKKFETEIKTEYIETVKDTTIYITDEAYFRAYLECDSMNRVVIKELENKAGKLIKQDVKYIDKYITVQAEIDSQAVYISWKETHDIKKEKEYVNVEVVKKVYPKWLIMAIALTILYLLFNIWRKFLI